MIYNLRKRKSSRWEKLLYKQQPFTDNYTDELQFLNQLRTNVDLVHYRLPDAVCGACIVMAQFDLIALFFCCFELIQLDLLGTFGLFWLCSTAFVSILCCSLPFQFADLSFVSFWRFSNLLEHCQTLVTVLAFGYLFTPIIRTLTTSISTDTIYACAIFLFLASLVVHDYGMDGPMVSVPLSVNLCLSASVFLISRLQSDLLAFLLLAFSLCLFCFWPKQRNALFARYSLLSPLFLLPLCIISIFGLAFLVGFALSVIHFLFHLFIVFFCPLLFIRMQRLKSTIHGPWDEATLRASIEG